MENLIREETFVLRLNQSIMLFRLVDSRDGTKYTVQVAHSASLLLSMILVYGWQQRLLCMAHLIGADTLPSKDQLDTNLVSSSLIK